MTNELRPLDLWGVVAVLQVDQQLICDLNPEVRTDASNDFHRNVAYHFSRINPNSVPRSWRGEQDSNDFAMMLRFPYTDHLMVVLASP